MVNITLSPHRTNLLANTTEPQKLFVMLRLLPDKDAAMTRPPLALAIVIDTSGSMLEFVDQEEAADQISQKGFIAQKLESFGGGYNLGLPTKLDQAIEAAHAFIDDDRLRPDDRVSIIHFDDKGDILLPLTPISEKSKAHDAVESLRKYSGGTQMAEGMQLAYEELSKVPTAHAKRAILLTDGKTFDEPKCRPLADKFEDTNTPIIAVGVGLEYNDELMQDIAQISNGRPYHLQDMSQLKGILEDEIGTSVREVVTDLQATISAVKGVTLDSLTRVYPSLAEVSTESQPYKLGNIAAGDFTVFIIELTVSDIARPPSKARLVQVGLAGHIPAVGRRDEFPVQELSITFTTDEAATRVINPEVLGYVQQKNVDRMVHEAVKQATVDAGHARKTLQVAVGMTRKLGNSAMTKMIENTLDELDQTGTISANTRKTVALGGRTKTVKTGATAAMEGVPSDEEIRKLTGA